MIASNYVKKIFNFQDDTSKIYARLWEFETWLRRMVYIELRAKRGDEWKQGLKPVSEAFEADKALTHMGTSEQNDFSYAQLYQLLDLIENNWHCFENYFPPKKLWKAKTHEISQIRNRIAHFRTSHPDDLQRVEQFLRDIDQGFWKFCTSYNEKVPALPQSTDPVTEHFLHLDPLPWGEIEPKNWARVGQVNRSLVVGLEVNKSYRPWFDANATNADNSGIFYDLSLLSLDRKFDVPRLLESTRRIHQHLVTVDFDRHSSRVRIVVPAVLGFEKVIEIGTEVVKWAGNAVNRGISPVDHKKLANDWPEYVLSDDDPMSFLDPDMPCPFFNI